MGTSVVPYERLPGISFGASQAEALARFGAPGRRSTNDVGLAEWRFDGFTLRFAADALVEATLDVEYVEIEGCRLPSSQGASVSFQQLGFVVAKLDAAAFMAHGFIVSPRFGLAFDPDQACALTIFSRDQLAGWLAMQ